MKYRILRIGVLTFFENILIGRKHITKHYYHKILKKFRGAPISADTYDDIGYKFM